MTEAEWYNTSSAFASWTALIAATNWQPQAELQLVEMLEGPLQLLVVLNVEDSRVPDREVRIGHPFALPVHLWQAGPKHMVLHLRQCLHRVVTHEADEWLVVAGARPFDPHKETNARRT